MARSADAVLRDFIGGQMMHMAALQAQLEAAQEAAPKAKPPKRPLTPSKP